jgi:hypothetical protein
VVLIGIGLTGTGMKYWGGGVFCADHADKRKVSAYVVRMYLSMF